MNKSNTPLKTEGPIFTRDCVLYIVKEIFEKWIVLFSNSFETSLFLL